MWSSLQQQLPARSCPKRAQSEHVPEDPVYHVFSGSSHSKELENSRRVLNTSNHWVACFLVASV